jgi:hypothetical protein
VNDVLLVNTIEGEQKAGDKEAGLFFGEAAAFIDMETEITSSEQVHAEVETITVLEGEVHVYQKRVLKV